ncbi:MAG: insulinase family protein [Propionibacteriaceae bacterium]|nr:insulinase family protein [Propionibacteriaceae bacterium]
MTLWTYPLPGQHIASCVLVLDLPLHCEPVGRDGLGNVVTRLLDAGTTTHPSVSFSQALEDHGGHFQPMVGQSTTQLMIDLPTNSLGAGLTLVAEAVKEPAFAADDFLSIQSQVYAEIDRHMARGSSIASIALRWSLFDHDLRISRPVFGDFESIPQITRDEVCDFHSRHYSPRGATLIIAGDIDPHETAHLAAQAFASWDSSVTSPVEVLPHVGECASHIIHREGAVQADVKIGWYGIDQKDPRWASLLVALTIMGGHFDSRLNTVLREEKGYTYGVSMGAHPFRHGGYIDFSSSTQTAMVHHLISEALEILAATQPFTPEEVDNAIAYLTESAPLALSTAVAVADQGASLVAAHLDVDHVTTGLVALRQVTPDSAMSAYHDLVNPDQGAIIVVGDSTGIGDLFSSHS